MAKKGKKDKQGRASRAKTAKETEPTVKLNLVDAQLLMTNLAQAVSQIQTMAMRLKTATYLQTGKTLVLQPVPTRMSETLVLGPMEMDHPKKIEEMTMRELVMTPASQQPKTLEAAMQRVKARAKQILRAKYPAPIPATSEMWTAAMREAEAEMATPIPSPMFDLTTPESRAKARATARQSVRASQILQKQKIKGIPSNAQRKKAMKQAAREMAEEAAMNQPTLLYPKPAELGPIRPQPTLRQPMTKTMRKTVERVLDEGLPSPSRPTSPPSKNPKPKTPAVASAGKRGSGRKRASKNS